jgi:hypothetical protein
VRKVGEKDDNGGYEKGHLTKVKYQGFLIEVWGFKINKICVFFVLKNQDIVYMFSFVVVLNSKVYLLHTKAFRTTM